MMTFQSVIVSHKLGLYSLTSFCQIYLVTSVYTKMLRWFIYVEVPWDSKEYTWSHSGAGRKLGFCYWHWMSSNSTCHRELDERRLIKSSYYLYQYLISSTHYTVVGTEWYYITTSMRMGDAVSPLVERKYCGSDHNHFREGAQFKILKRPLGLRSTRQCYSKMSHLPTG